MDVLVALLTGLLGGATGAIIARSTEREKWLRQNRSEVFAKFLGLLADARTDATSALHDPGHSPNQRNERVTEIYTAPLAYARVVRFYLPQESREEFSGLVNNVWSLHESVSLGQSRLRTLDEKIDRIQEILEFAITTDASLLCSQLRSCNGFIKRRAVGVVGNVRRRCMR